MSEQHQRDQQQAVTDEEFLVQQAREWQDRCWICAQAGQASDHELYFCQAEGSQRARSWMMRVRTQVRYAPFTSCFQCGMPQTLCFGWQGPGAACAHRGLLYPMIGMMLFGGPEQGRVHGLWVQRLGAQGIDAHDERQVIEFLGRRGEGGGWREHTELVRTFIWLRRIYDGVGR